MIYKIMGGGVAKPPLALPVPMGLSRVSKKIYFLAWLFPGENVSYCHGVNVVICVSAHCKNSDIL